MSGRGRAALSALAGETLRRPGQTTSEDSTETKALSEDNAENKPSSEDNKERIESTKDNTESRTTPEVVSENEKGSEKDTCNEKSYEDKKYENKLLIGLIEQIVSITSPDDLQLQEVSTQVKTNAVEEADLKLFVTDICDRALTTRKFASVAAKLFGLTAHHHAGESKIRSLLLNRIQKEYGKKDELFATNHNDFVTSALFLGEVFHHVKSDKNTPFKILAKPLLIYLRMITKPYISEDSKTNEEKSSKSLDANADDDMAVIAKLLLLNGQVLHEFEPSEIVQIVQDLTEIMCCCKLNPSSCINMLTVLADLWPLVAKDTHPRTKHAMLAAKLGVSLYI